MPKQKTHRGSAKRFKRTGSGKLKEATQNVVICLQTKPRNKNVNYVNQLWFPIVITSVSSNN